MLDGCAVGLLTHRAQIAGKHERGGSGEPPRTHAKLRRFRKPRGCLQSSTSAVTYCQMYRLATIVSRSGRRRPAAPTMAVQSTPLPRRRGIVAGPSAAAPAARAPVRDPRSDRATSSPAPAATAPTSHGCLRTNRPGEQHLRRWSPAPVSCPKQPSRWACARCRRSAGDRCARLDGERAIGYFFSPERSTASTMRKAARMTPPTSIRPPPGTRSPMWVSRNSTSPPAK